MSTTNIVNKNFYFLTVLQIFNIGVPLLTIPYLINVLDVEKYGIVIWAQTIIFFFTTIIRFGFDISITKNISVHRKNKLKLSIYVNSIIIIKVMLFIIIMLALALLINFTDKLASNKEVIWLSTLVAFSEIFSIPWFFQGIEKMKLITYSISFSRLLYLLLIFSFIKGSNDYYLVPILNGVTLLFSSIIFIYFAYFKYGLTFFIPSLKVIKKIFIQSASFFTSRASVLFLMKFNIIILESIAGFAAVAFYDIAEKLISILRMPFALYNQSLYPNIAKSKDMNKVVFIIKRSLFAGFLIYFLLFLLKGEIFSLLTNDNSFNNYLYVLNIFGLLIIFSSIDYFLGTTTLVVNGYVKEFNLSVLYAAGIYLFIIIIIYVFGKLTLMNITSSIVLGELFQLLYRSYFIWKNNIFVTSS